MVALEVHWSDGTGSEGFGFVVGGEGANLYVATANHVLRPPLEARLPDVVVDRILVRRPQRPTATLLGTPVARFDEALDLGVVAVPAEAYGDWTPDVLAPATRPLAPGDPVWTVRHDPGSVWDFNYRPGSFARYDPLRQLRLDGLPAPRGTSGAPVIAEGGIVAMVVQDEGLAGSTAVAIDAIRQRFALWGLPWALSDAPAATVRFAAGSFQRGASPHDLATVGAMLRARAPELEPDFGNAARYGPVVLGAFEIDTHEVTWDEYQAFVGSTGAAPMPDDILGLRASGDQPVFGVTWGEADAYCQAQGKRLPTEAEWERAARGTEGRVFPWADSVDGLEGVVCGQCNGGTGPAPVGTAPLDRTPEGVADLGGNVREWVSDWYSSRFYEQPSRRNPENRDVGEHRVVRGGAWNRPLHFLPAFRRGAEPPWLRDPGIGFRCARSLGSS